MKNFSRGGKPGERSFTLLETVVALGILSSMIVELIQVQGNAIYFTEYSESMTKGIWYAKRVMSQVEYQWAHRDFSEIKQVGEKEVPFSDQPEGEDFRYDLTIEDWKLPLIDMLTGGGAGGSGEGDSEDGEADQPKEDGKASPAAGGDMIGSAISQIFGGEFLKVASVKVSWPEGAKRNEVYLTYLLTNQRKADEYIATLESVAKGLGKDKDKPKNRNPKGTSPGDGAGGKPPPLPTPNGGEDG